MAHTSGTFNVTLKDEQAEKVDQPVLRGANKWRVKEVIDGVAIWDQVNNGMYIEISRSK